MILKRLTIFLWIMTVVACTTIVKQKGCYVAEPYVSGTYTGACRNGKAHGFGVAVGKDTYRGDFVDGVFNGNGTYIWSDGDRYEGQFKNGQIHGRGVMRYINGDEQAGVWENGVLTQPEKSRND